MRKVLALLAFIVSIFTLASCGSSHGASVSTKPVSLKGEWHQVNSNPSGWMTASISGDSIQVNLRGRDSSSIFWLGTFDTQKRSANKYKIVSLGDQDAMKYKIAASNESQKTFTYDHGILSFEFSALGSSTTIHMTKTKSFRIPTATPTTHRPSSNKATAQTPKPKKTTKVASPPRISTRKK
jgi:hypothetical protein